jgi:protein phosphatase
MTLTGNAITIPGIQASSRHLEWDAYTATGPRPLNADFAAEHTDQSGRQAFAVADGIGSTEYAARAARLAAKVAVTTAPIIGPVQAILSARRAIVNVTAGDTVLAVGVPSVTAGIPHWDFAWVGDCRAYLWHDGRLDQLTTDHTVAQYFRAHGQEPAPSMEHVVTDTVRTSTLKDIGRTSVALPPTGRARILLTSDGVHKVLSVNRIAQLLASPMPPSEVSRALVASAHRYGGRDNAAAVVVDLS